MNEPWRSRNLAGVALLLGIVVLLFGVWRVWLTPAAPGATPAQTVTASPTAVIAPDDQFIEESSPVPPATTAAPVASDNTPADQWAETVLSLAVPLLDSGMFSPDGLAWWQSEAQRGLLTAGTQLAYLDDRPIEPINHTDLEVLVPRVDNPNQLTTLGSVMVDGAVMRLESVAPSPSTPGGSWVISNTDISTALRALALQAADNDLVVHAAISFDGEETMRLVLVSVHRASDATPPPTEIIGSTATPTLPFTPTPTREPEAYMGQVIESFFTSVLTQAEGLSARTTDAVAAEHPWSGVLTWTVNGPAVNERVLPISDAGQVTFYLLEVDASGEQTTSRFFSAIYEFETTRFPDQQVLFQQHRMDEVLRWMIQIAAERGQRLVVTYDDFGSRQAITVVGLRPIE